MQCQQGGNQQKNRAHDQQVHRPTPRRPRGDSLSESPPGQRRQPLLRGASVKTLKYHPGFPGRFEDIATATAFCRSFFPWYNTEHRHGGIAMVTPDDVHHHRAPRVLAQRERTLHSAWTLHPERFVHGTPTTQTPMQRGTTFCTGRPRSTGLRSGGPGRSRLLRSAKLAGATRSGHRRQTPAVLEDGNGTPDLGRPRLPKGALRLPFRWAPRGARPRQRQMLERDVAAIPIAVSSISTSDKGGMASEWSENMDDSRPRREVRSSPR